ncbi:hypothetical protein ACFWMV_27930 [Streptomyces mutabilis]|uniref:hypothetical protein n=1 Tax=Streptomyces mutabilis TaxID=67332 RepID=UPI00365AF045
MVRDTYFLDADLEDPVVSSSRYPTGLLASRAPDELRAEEDRLAEAEAALDDTMSPDDPRIEDLSARRCAHETALGAAIDRSGLDEALDVLLDEEDEHTDEDEGETRMSATEAIGKMPYDFSPARVRYEERVVELLHSADQNGDTHRPADWNRRSGRARRTRHRNGAART